jgi:hypothetical protein
MMMNEEDVKPDISSYPAEDVIRFSPPPMMHDFSPPSPPATTAATIRPREKYPAADAQKTEARALCEVISKDFTVWGEKGCVTGREVR